MQPSSGHGGVVAGGGRVAGSSVVSRHRAAKRALRSAMEPAAAVARAWIGGGRV
jgi:hypothetical protein